jgi:hypothetical protein
VPRLRTRGAVPPLLLHIHGSFELIFETRRQKKVGKPTLRQLEEVENDLRELKVRDENKVMPV